MKDITYLLLALPAALLSGCDNKTRTVSYVSYSDPQLAPMLQAIAASDRVALGFSSISTNAIAHFDVSPNTRRDAEIIIFDTPALNGGVHRNIEFRKTESGYKWIREVEAHPGPKTFTTSGHTNHEKIYIAYDTTEVMGIASNKLHIGYEGLGSPLISGKELTLDQVMPILTKWSQKH